MYFFFFNDTATTEIYTLSLHDALPISRDESHAAETARDRLAQGARPRAAVGSGGLNRGSHHSARLSADEQGGGADRRRSAQHQTECRARHGHRVDALGPISGAGATAQGGAARLRARDHVQSRRVRGPDGESPAELPLLHARALLPAREHPAAEHQYSLRDDQ